MDKRVIQIILLDFFKKRDQKSQHEAYHNHNGHLERGRGNCYIINWGWKLQEGNLMNLNMVWKGNKEWVLLLWNWKQTSCSKKGSVYGEQVDLLCNLDFLTLWLTLFLLAGILAHPHHQINKKQMPSVRGFSVKLIKMQRCQRFQSIHEALWLSNKSGYQWPESLRSLWEPVASFNKRKWRAENKHNEEPWKRVSIYIPFRQATC